MIKICRIDDRLMHGQVAVLWVSSVGVDTIVVANDTYANNPMLSMTLTLAKPPGVDMKVLKKVDAFNYLNDSSNDQKSIFVVVENTSDAKELFNSVRLVKKINVGGLRSAPGKGKVLSTIFLNEQDFSNLIYLSENEVDVFLQVKPDDKKVGLLEAKSIWEKTTK